MSERNINLQESFNNIKIVCDNTREPGLNNAERQAVNESLNNIAKALQEGEAIKAEVKLLKEEFEALKIRCSGSDAKEKGVGPDEGPVE